MVYDRTVNELIANREDSDRFRLRMGLRLTRLGAGAVPKLARDTNHSRTSLYEWEGVWVLLWRLFGWSARRTYDEHPTWTYKHVRRVVRSSIDIEDAREMLDAIDEGDPQYPHYNSLPMTPDMFDAYVTERCGGEPPKDPIFDERGKASEVAHLLSQQMRHVKPETRIRVRVDYLD